MWEDLTRVHEVRSYTGNLSPDGTFSYYDGKHHTSHNLTSLLLPYLSFWLSNHSLWRSGKAFWPSKATQLHSRFDLNSLHRLGLDYREQTRNDYTTGTSTTYILFFVSRL